MPHKAVCSAISPRVRQNFGQNMALHALKECIKYSEFDILFALPGYCENLAEPDSSINQ